MMFRFVHARSWQRGARQFMSQRLNIDLKLTSLEDQHSMNCNHPNTHTIHARYIYIYLHLGSFGGRISRMRYGIGCALQTIFLTFFDVDVKFIS